MMAMEYFCCYHSYFKKCEKLTDQELGRLLRALLVYSEFGERQDLTGRESIAFDFIADDIDRAKKSYDEKCRKNSENGKAGGRPPKAKKAVGFSKSEKSQRKKEDKEEDKELPPITPQGGREVSLPKYHPDWFERFWALYPRKTNREVAVRAWDKLKPGLELCKVMDKAIRLQMQSAQWQDSQHIPHPSTWLNGKRWQDELEASTQKEHRSYDENMEDCL